MDSKIKLADQMKKILDACYQKAISGLPGVSSCDQLAYEYSKKYKSRKLAVKKLVKMQVPKCSTSGFITGLGGLLSLPVAVPANIASVVFVQLQMIGAIAAIGGNDVRSDEVQALCYACLAGVSVSDLLKPMGINATNKAAMAGIRKIPFEVIKKINQKVGFRLVTKAGEKGVVNLTKMLPIIGGGVDYVSTKIIAQRAYKTFILHDLEWDVK